MTELSSVVSILFFSFLFCLGSFVMGIVIGWFANEYFDNYFSAKLTYHPEMFDDAGHIIDEELLSLRLIEEEDDYEED